MKAEITELWETGREIISVGGQSPTSAAALAKCENVLLEKIEGGYTALIDNSIYFVKQSRVQHPSGGGALIVIEVF